MIDFLMIAPDEPTLIAAIGSYAPVGSQPLYSTDGGWRSDIAFPVVVSTTNPDGSTTPLPGQYALWIGLPTKDATLAASPTCSLIADRDAAQAGSPSFILQTAMTQIQLDTYIISPTVAGSNYPFGNAP